ncbi:glycosyltransferase family 2 protein [Methylobacter sp. Wu1]|uniref:glycosyltransferase family 2 protein n=1 Tax=Methylobacter sp. Wu1 TaxID=3119359 RepID=UPI002F925101
MQVINFLAAFITFLLALPLWIVISECWIALFAGKKQDDHQLIQTNLSKATVLIPAHNEAAVIAKTLRRLIEQFAISSAEVLSDSENAFSIRDNLEKEDTSKGYPRIIVVADNCTDNTAEIARQFNVTVLERKDNELRGKGYALDFGIQFLKNQSEIDVLVVLDADCELKPLAIEKLVHRCLTLDLPVQAIYMMCLPEKASFKQRIAGFAWLVKNKIRPLAVSLLNLPVTLTGTGMAFPWHLMNQVNLAHGHIVEDMQLGIDLTLKGYPPRLCQNAEVFSYFPEQQSAQKTQRTRWEHGHLMTIIEQVPLLIKQAVIDRNLKFLAMALDVAVPPLALLVLLSLGGIGLLSIFYAITNWLLPVGLLLVSFVLFALTILVVWWREGRALLSLADLCAVPIYIASKLSVYFSFISGRQKDWVRTERDGGGEL